MGDVWSVANSAEQTNGVLRPFYAVDAINRAYHARIRVVDVPAGSVVRLLGPDTHRWSVMFVRTAPAASDAGVWPGEDVSASQSITVTTTPLVFSVTEFPDLVARAWYAVAGLSPSQVVVCEVLENV